MIDRPYGKAEYEALPPRLRAQVSHMLQTRAGGELHPARVAPIWMLTSDEVMILRAVAEEIRPIRPHWLYRLLSYGS